MRIANTKHCFGKLQSMQSKKEIPNDARSFPQIWATLSAGEKDDLVYELIKAKCCKTRTAIGMWGRGDRQPSNALTRDTIAKVIGKTLGLHVFSSSLFPRV